jgi:hypothetical protein
MPFIPLNTFDTTAPLAGCTNAEVDRHERMLAMMSSESLLNALEKHKPTSLGNVLRDAVAMANESIYAKPAPSPASLMLANLALDYPTPDEAQVAMLEDAMGELDLVAFHDALDSAAADFEMLVTNGADLTPETSKTLGYETTKIWFDEKRDMVLCESVSVEKTIDELIGDAEHRAWADQFGKDIVAAGEARAKAEKR